MRFRRRFREVVGRQLELFAGANMALLEQIRDARRAYDDASRADAEDRFADYQAWVADATDALVEIREHYAATLDDHSAEEYAEAFNRAARRRFPELALELEDQPFDDC